jgi:uncharacterized DUF497 family protein
MNYLSFSWDSKKSRLNLKKHKVSFDEAKSVFYDENAIDFYDMDHSEVEDRFLLLGLSERLHILLVSYCFHKDASVIRIISARKATKNEAKYYHGG